MERKVWQLCHPKVPSQILPGKVLKILNSWRPPVKWLKYPWHSTPSREIPTNLQMNPLGLNVFKQREMKQSFNMFRWPVWSSLQDKSLLEVGVLKCSFKKADIRKRRRKWHRNQSFLPQIHPLHLFGHASRQLK